jgi:hypothetical protein
MISRSRLFTRQPPSRDAKSIYIFGEGVSREKDYFKYFKELNSRINIEYYDLKDTEDNSPSGLWNIAMACLIKSEENPSPKYELLEDDEVWIVFDTDVDKANSRETPIKELRENCVAKNWNVAQSNPCFEVWLYYHFHSQKPTFDNMHICKNWKQELTKIGGFNSNKEPIYIEQAIVNSEHNFSRDDNAIPKTGTTEVHFLAKVIFDFVKVQIAEVLTQKQ